MIARLHKILFSNYGSLSIDTRLYGPYLIVRSSVFENNVSWHCVVINAVSDSEISPHSHNWCASRRGWRYREGGKRALKQSRAMKCSRDSQNYIFKTINEVTIINYRIIEMINYRTKSRISID